MQITYLAKCKIHLVHDIGKLLILETIKTAIYPRERSILYISAKVKNKNRSLIDLALPVKYTKNVFIKSG